MVAALPTEWRNAFLDALQRPGHAAALQQALDAGRLGDWTTVLTSVAVEAGERMGWQATAKGHRLSLLPIARSEYLALDVMAFSEAATAWRFPSLTIELENARPEERVAYSLWKLLCVNASLRVLVCYREEAKAARDLVAHLQQEVIGAMLVPSLERLPGETVVAVGLKGRTEEFPYSFFRWWRLDPNLGHFEVH